MNWPVGRTRHTWRKRQPGRPATCIEGRAANATIPPERSKAVQLHETLFFKQFVAVIVGTVLVVASYAFVSIPLTLASGSGIHHLS